MMFEKYSISNIEKLPETSPNFENTLPVKRTHLGWKTRNPGNIRPFRNFTNIYKGAVKYESNNKGNFIQFPTFEMGYKAMLNDLKGKKSGKSMHTNGSETLKEVLYIYCPPSENNSFVYVAQISKLYGCKEETPIKLINIDRLVMCMIYIENPQIYKYLFT